MRPAIQSERAGLPSVVITTSGFTMLAQRSARSGGIAGLRTAEYPGPLGVHGPQALQDNIRTTLFDRVVAGLTRPCTEAQAPAAGPWDPRRIVFSGSLEAVNAFFAANGLSDGLPVVPPTRERIEQFLAHTARGPEEVIATLASANLVAVPWNIAANAVMAGCEPRHMPLLIAAAQALGDDRCSLSNIGSSSGLFPFLLINGPVARELGVACDGQLISRSPNTAIGRAIGLIVRNIAGFRPGETYMGTFGYPLAFVLAENESESPWEPFHVGQGFAAGESTVTVGVTTNWGSSPEASSSPQIGAAQVALELLCREITKKARIYDFPTRGPRAETVMLTVLMSPSIAKSLAEAGYTKDRIAQHLYENTTMRLGEFEWLTRHTFPSSASLREKVRAGTLPDEFLGDPDDLVRVLSGPDVVHVVVCGDPNRNRLMCLEGGHTRPTTRAIERDPCSIPRL